MSAFAEVGKDDINMVDIPKMESLRMSKSDEDLETAYVRCSGERAVLPDRVSSRQQLFCCSIICCSLLLRSISLFSQ